MVGKFTGKIDKNIPIQSQKHRGGRNTEKYPFREMKVGDSFLSTKESPYNIRQAAWRLRAKAKGFKNFTVSVIKVPGGYRCWRTK